MLKVVIADDEQHICRLIHALVEWETMDMEVMEFASNGLEAIDLVGKWSPDILITDIRMPGCDGMELIKSVRSSHPNIEIVIISGHAQFAYAQTAMRYSVGNYLLKPINKVELNQTLLTISDRICERKKSESGLQQLIEHTENSKHQMKSSLIAHLLDGTLEEPTSAMLREGCGLEVQGLAYQTFIVKVDFTDITLNRSVIEVAHEKAHAIIEANLRNLCSEIIVKEKISMAYGIIFYDGKKSEDIRRVIRDCLNQLMMQKSILGPLTFTIALSSVRRDTKQLVDSLVESATLIEERLVTSVERIIESIPREPGAISPNALEKYIRMILQAIQVYSKEDAVLAVEELKREVISAGNPRGAEVQKLVLSAGATLLMQVNYKNQQDANEKFRGECEVCGTIEQLFDTLLNLGEDIITEMEKERESDILRPVRLAKQYIRNHYNEQITLEEVSEVVGLSTSYFSALFKKETGEGFAKYLIGIRMDEAKRLLRESSLSASAICKTVGYNDSKHFTHTFEKATGLKPSAYRKLYG